MSNRSSKVAFATNGLYWRRSGILLLSLIRIIDKIEAVDGSGIRNVRLYVIDSCEYIGHINAFNSDVLTHKGNCKFCAERIEKNKIK